MPNLRKKEYYLWKLDKEIGYILIGTVIGWNSKSLFYMKNIVAAGPDDELTPKSRYEDDIFLGSGRKPDSYYWKRIDDIGLFGIKYA